MATKQFDLFGPLDQEEPKETNNNEIHNAISRYAEFMVCAYLTKMGHHVMHVDTKGFDLILGYKGRSYRIDVKSTDYVYAGPFKSSCAWMTKKEINKGNNSGRPVMPTDTDLLALFHNRFETVVFWPVDRPIERVQLPLAQVKNAGIGMDSLDNAIKMLMKTGI